MFVKTNHLFKNSDHKLDLAKPKILETARNRIKLFFLETLFIDKLKPDINVDRSSITLYLFNTRYCFFVFAFFLFTPRVGLNLNFEFESVHEVLINLNSTFSKAMKLNLNLVFSMSMNLNLVTSHSDKTTDKVGKRNNNVET